MSDDEGSQPEVDVNDEEGFVVKDAIIVSYKKTSCAFEARREDGTTFIHAECRARKLERLLLAHDGSFNAKVRSTIVAKMMNGLIKRRDDKFRELLSDYGCTALTHAKKGRYTGKMVKLNLLQMPDVCEILVHDKYVRILCKKPGTPFWFEVSASNLKLLHDLYVSMCPP